MNRILLLASLCLLILPLVVQAQGPSGECPSCGEVSSNWEYLGPIQGPTKGLPRLQFWNCPMCKSSRVSMSARYPPGGVNPWTGRGRTAWGSGSGHIRLPEQRWNRWTR